MDCKYKVNIKNIQYNYKIRLAELQEKYKFNLFCTGGKYDDTEIREEIASLEEENEYLNSIVDQLPKVKVEGEYPTLDNTLQAKMKVDLKGNTQQNGTPTPDTPIPVQVVTGDNTIKVTGKNLLDLPNNSITSNGITATITNGKLKIVGTTTVNWFSICNLNIPLESGTYIFSYTNKKVNRYNFNIKYADNTTQIIYGNAYGNTPITLNQNATITGMFSDSNATGATFDYEDYLMLEKGSIATDYEPYSSNSYNIDLGVKNLWNSEDMKSGFLPMTGSYPTTNSTYPNARYIIIPLYKGQSLTTYSIFGYNSFRMRYIDIETNQIIGTVATGTNNNYCTSAVSYQGGWSNGTVTATKNILLGLFDYDGTMSTSGSYKITYGTKIQNVAETPIELCKIGNYKDRIYPLNGKWYLNKQIGKVVLDGSEEGWNVRQGNNTNLYVYYLLNNLVQNSIKESKNCLSNYFIVDITSGLIQKDGGFRITEYSSINRIWLCVNSNIATTISNFKTWLSTHNTSVYYVLATPTTEEITDSTLISQLEALKEAESYLGQTSISQVNNDAPFIINASTLYDLNNLITRVAILETE